MEKNPFEKIKPHVQKDLPFSDVSKNKKTRQEELREIREEQRLKGHETVEKRRKELQRLEAERAKEGQKVLRRVGRTKFLTEQIQVDANEEGGAKEESSIVWGPRYFDRQSGRAGQDSVQVENENGKWLIDGKESSFENMKDVVGPAWDRLLKTDEDFIKLVKMEEENQEK